MIDKEALFKPQLPEQEVPVPGVGNVRVRGLTLAEVHQAKTKAGLATGQVSGDKLEKLDHLIISRGMVEPELTAQEVARWAKAAPAGTLVGVLDAIQELSGMAEGAQKEAMLTFREEE